MKALKMNLQQLGNVEVLTRSQMKDVLGAQAPADGQNCFAHTKNADGSWGQQVAFSSQDSAHTYADSAASSTGQHWYYCCDAGCGGGGQYPPVVV